MAKWTVKDINMQQQHVLCFLMDSPVDKGLLIGELGYE
jgi:hypothetical protein